MNQDTKQKKQTRHKEEKQRRGKRREEKGRGGEGKEKEGRRTCYSPVIQAKHRLFPLALNPYLSMK